MNTSTRVHTNTKQILNLLDKRPLSFQELARRVHESDEVLSEDINELVHEGVVAMRFHNHHVTYRVKKIPPLKKTWGGG
ncbi:MAG: hypothetical protein A3C02_04100 [Candidatus Andersenbacteria bacterium RIFCSPHIGHO2_02_FULL_45_11]|uniref:HTH arsR-type domain-containing protein n=1 Tax=Candidatus Andersenbacteria bacterium RIFCSPHIGHO2_12_FULL_45_11 TaxID=1797281 RepID=A0A1G1WZB8_9BACT|nr:MAG: hypothetical protein A2805_00810 [Candidatus Andersenbacteria bacterium RIFCSPHIGHO2_01_FULL_46_36]OGY33069.1 MAG: hypothetical protein A3D99_01270 [Candidatus Andersenbacteria bacterium RIFCSPHIGHO2_12_FULL_45_11]OGY33412.1 MAG: hypothetical protein A3C02_04100 [Candidatus Andersenbacteria bacterium RIFCSPHIGHO2_02_FULL_45_11]